jgi:hypothetical protein
MADKNLEDVARAYVLGTHIIQFAGIIALYPDEEWDKVMTWLIESSPNGAELFRKADELRRCITDSVVSLDTVAKDFPPEEA